MNIDLPLAAVDSFWLRLIFGLIIGAVLGSFGTMLAYRLPRGLSIIAPRSHCPLCKTPLGVADLVPLFSWIFAKGRCRHCGAEISPRYVFIEAATSLLCALLTVFIGFSPVLALGYGIIVAAIVGLCIKIRV